MLNQSVGILLQLDYKPGTMVEYWYFKNGAFVREQEQISQGYLRVRITSDNGVIQVCVASLSIPGIDSIEYNVFNIDDRSKHGFRFTYSFIISIDQPLVYWT